MTKTAQLLADRESYLLADLGYHHHRLLTPRTQEENTGKAMLKLLRMVVEHVNGDISTWQFAKALVKVSPETQILGLICIYKIQECLL